MRRLIATLVLALLVGLTSRYQKQLGAAGVQFKTAVSSGQIFNGRGTVYGVILSTGDGTAYAVLLDSGNVRGANGGVGLTSFTTGQYVTPQLIFLSTYTASGGVSIGNNSPRLPEQGVYISTGAFIWFSAPGRATVYFDR